MPEVDSELWVGFQHLQDLGISQERLIDCDVLCLPENIEIEKDIKKLFEASETVHLYKMFKNQGLKVCSLHDFGIDIPILERRGEGIYFGTIIIKEIVLKIAAGIIIAWISKKLIRSDVSLKLHVIKENIESKVDYNGDGETLVKILEALIRENDEAK